jgi:NYN domain/OST-HTH/LOTUS domain
MGDTGLDKALPLTSGQAAGSPTRRVTMNDDGVARVAVYLDFDNIVISRYDQVNGRGQFQRDRVRGFSQADRPADGDLAEKVRRATVDIGAVIDFASSFGTLVLTRAYADWSAPVNADYRGQLVSRAVDLVQLFPAAAYAKNGADIRLAVDAVEDMFRLPDLTHVVIVAGDSDYIALAQRCKRLGRYVVGVGVAGSTSRALAAACDELVTYDALPGIEPADAAQLPDSQATEAPAQPDEPGTTSPARGSRRGRRSAAAVIDETDPDPEDPQEAATRLLERALRLGQEKDDADWLHSSAVKSQMRRMDPSFSERALGYRSFSDFVKSRAAVAELDETDPVRLVRLNPARAKR